MKDGWGCGAETREQVQLRTVKAEGPTELRIVGLGRPGEPLGPPGGHLCQSAWRARGLQSPGGLPRCQGLG